MARHRQKHAIFILIFLVLVVASSSRHTHHHDSILRHHIMSDSEDNEILDVDEKLALDHSQRVAEGGACDLPKLHVVHISDHYPGRYFLPHCTLLHRCGKHAGCCGTDRLRCVAKTKEKLNLHFYSVKIGEHGIPAQRKIEKLTFYNHTQCACVPVQHVSKHDL